MSSSGPLVSVGPGETDLIFGPRGFLQMNTSGQIMNQGQFRLNMQKLIASIIGYSKYKEAKYEENNPRKDLQVLRQDLKAQISLIDAEAKKAGAENLILSDDNMREKLEDKAKEDSLEKYQATIGNLAKFEAKISDIRAVLKMFCIDYPALSDADKLKTEVNLANRIKDAILNLRTEVSGTSETAVNTRNQIEMILLNFANAWKAFKGSYMLNFCLTGGAGVGKTTLAKAISKCLSAYGILATNYIKEASKTDFIGQYVGQSVHKTDATLYGSLEGVCFIDEAYAVGQVEWYGQEALDELTFFTQKFPGCISIIIAGYEKEMKKHFFDKNEGLNRRFPNRIDLKPYDIQTIKATLVNRVLVKLGVKDPRKKEDIEKILERYSNVLTMLYADMLQDEEEFTSEIKKNYDKFHYFNLYPVYNLIVAAGTPSEKKRDILKTYFLKKYCGIPEGDLFPNQMGDVQNIVDFILTTPRVLNPSLGSLTTHDILDVFNKYFDMRKIGKLYIGGNVPGNPEEAWELGNVPEEEPISWDFTVNGLSSREMEDKIINPFFAYVVEDPAERKRLRQKGVFTLNATNPKEAIIIKQMDKLYTEAVIYLQEYQDAVLDGYQEIKLSTHIDLNFLKQEHSSYLDAQAKDQAAFATIAYSTPGSLGSLDGRGLEVIGKFPELPQEKIADVCKDTSVVLALQSATARDVEAQDDGGRAVRPPPAAAAAAGAGPRVGGPPPSFVSSAPPSSFLQDPNQTAANQLIEFLQTSSYVVTATLKTDKFENKPFNLSFSDGKLILPNTVFLTSLDFTPSSRTYGIFFIDSSGPDSLSNYTTINKILYAGSIKGRFIPASEINSFKPSIPKSSTNFANFQYTVNMNTEDVLAHFDEKTQQIYLMKLDKNKKPNRLETALFKFDAKGPASLRPLAPPLGGSQQSIQGRLVAGFNPTAWFTIQSGGRRRQTRKRIVKKRKATRAKKM